MVITPATCPGLRVPKAIRCRNLATRASERDPLAGMALEAAGKFALTPGDKALALIEATEALAGRP